MVLDPRLLHQGLLNTDPGVFALQIAETRAQNFFMTRTSGWPARQDELSSRVVLTHPWPIRADRSVPSRIAGRARAGVITTWALGRRKQPTPSGR